MLYLDNAATSYKKPSEFYKAMRKYTKRYSVNAGRGGHKFSTDGMSGIMKTSEELASLFNIDNPERIAYSANATMSLNLAINGILSRGGHVIVTQMEHNSVLRPVHKFGNYTIVKADNFGRVNPDDIKKSIRDDTKLIISTHASNTCGTVLPIAQIGEIAHTAGIPFLVDAAQTAGCRPIDVEEMNIDMLAFSAHKGLLGPLGIGGLYVRDGIELEQIISGGTGSYSKNLEQPRDMPDFLHSGTLNTPAIMALSSSIEYIRRSTPEIISAKQTELAFMLIQRLLNIKDVTVYGITDRNMGERNGTVLFNISGMDSAKVCEILNNEYKIAVRGGWHCAYPSHCALGSEKSGAIRASFGAFSGVHDVFVLANAVNKIAKNKL